MGAIEGVPLLLSAGELTARRVESTVAELHNLIDEQGGRAVFVNGLRQATAQIEIAAVGVFSLFEARLQSHFPQGSFFKKLKAHLNDLGETDLSNDIWHYYLAINVLKHGKGASYDELCKSSNLPFSIKLPGEVFFNEGDVAEPEGLIDVTAKGFFEGLLHTLEEVRVSLEG